MPPLQIKKPTDQPALGVSQAPVVHLAPVQVAQTTGNENNSNLRAGNPDSSPSQSFGEIAGNLLGGITKFSVSPITTAIIDPTKELAAQYSHNKQALLNAQQDAMSDNPFSSVRGAGDAISTAIVKGSVEKAADTSQKNTTTTLTKAWGGTPQATAVASLVGTSNKQDVLNQLLAEGGVSQQTSKGSLVAKGLEAGAGVFAPLAFASPPTKLLSYAAKLKSAFGDTSDAATAMVGALDKPPATESATVRPPEPIPTLKTTSKSVTVATPKSDEESLFSTHERATTPESEPPPSPYLLRKGIGVTSDMVTYDDRVQAQLTHSTPEYVAGQRITNLRNTEAEQAAQAVLENGGTRDEAVKAYRGRHPGITTKDATFRISRMAKESKLPLRPNERSINPEEGQHDLPVAKEGDYQQAPINKARVEGTVDNLLRQANESLSGLSEADRTNFEDYLEETKDVSKAEDPKAVQRAIADSLKLTDTGNAFDRSVGGQTPHIDKYFPGYVKRPEGGEILPKDQLKAEQELEDELGPKEWNKLTTTERQDLVNERLQTVVKNTYDDENFGGFRNQKRTFANRAERQAAQVEDEYSDPRDALTRYANGLKFKIGGDAFKKAATEADSEEALNKGIGGTVRYGRGTNDRVDLSAKGHQSLKSSDITANKKGVLTRINTGIKKSLIALGVPHAVIIPPRYLGARLALETPDIGGLLRGDTDITKVELNRPIASDNVEFGHQIDSPLHGSRFGAGVSRTTKNPFARLVYNWLLPKMHDSLLGAAKDYMDSRGINYDSPQAREIGHQINDVMGYSKNGTGFFDQSTFAPSLIKSTVNMYRRSVLPNGTVARGGFIGQQLANEALGFISKAASNQISQNQGQPQNKSQDDFWSTLIKEAISPSVYTPYRNAKGEQVDLGIPGQYQGDLLKIGLNLQRGSDGQLHVGVNSPSQVASNAAQTVKNIASPVAGVALSAITNQAYNGSQIRNPYAPLTTQIAQTAINSASNVLPINLQGFVNQQTASHLPSDLRSAIQLNQNAGPTILRVAGNTLGMNPKADTTTGQGPAIKQYYDGQAAGKNYVAAHSNNATTQATNETAFTQYFSRTKNDANQTILLSPSASKANAALLASNPTVLAGVQVAEKANGKGNYNPIWDLPTSKLRAYQTYESLPDGDPNRTVMEQKNPWLIQVFGQEQTYFNSLSTTNKAVPGEGYVSYPAISPNQSALMSQLSALSANKNRTPDQDAQLQQLTNNPDVQSAFTLQDNYINARRQSEGLSPIPFPSQSLTPAQSALLSQESALPSGTGAKSALIKANQDEWNQIQNVLAQETIYNVEKYGGVIQQGGTEPNFLKDVYNAGHYDIAKGTDTSGKATYQLNPELAFSGGQSGGSTFTGSSGSSKGGSHKTMRLPKARTVKVKKLKLRKAPKQRNRVKLANKPHRLNVTAARGIQPVSVARPTSVVKLSH